MSACYVCWRLIRKEWGKALKYEISVWSGLGVGVLLFPALLRHIVEGNKGREPYRICCRAYTFFDGVYRFFSGKIQVQYIYPGYESALSCMSQEYKETPGINVTKGDHLVIGNCLFLEMQEQTYPLELDRVEELPDILEDRFSSLPDNLIL